MDEKLDREFEIIERANALAKKFLNDMMVDGDPPTVWVTTFMTGAAMCAWAEEMSEKDFLEGCKYSYVAYKELFDGMHE
jgi:hypothetical protein